LASEFTQFVQDKLAKKAEKVITGEVVDEQWS
jgi:hypothetical protein